MSHMYVCIYHIISPVLTPTYHPSNDLTGTALATVLQGEQACNLHLINEPSYNYIMYYAGLLSCRGNKYAISSSLDTIATPLCN